MNGDGKFLSINRDEKRPRSV